MILKKHKGGRVGSLVVLGHSKVQIRGLGF